MVISVPPRIHHRSVHGGFATGTDGSDRSITVFLGIQPFFDFRQYHQIFGR